MTVHVGELRAHVTGAGTPPSGASAAPQAPESPWGEGARFAEQARAVERDCARTRAEGFDD